MDEIGEGYPGSLFLADGDAVGAGVDQDRGLLVDVAFENFAGEAVN